jgi:hypothetical protein
MKKEKSPGKKEDGQTRSEKLNTQYTQREEGT